MSRNRPYAFAPVLMFAAMILAVACVPIQAPEVGPAVDASAESASPQTDSPRAPGAIQRAADVPRIGVDEAKTHFDNKTAVFVDSRSQDAYDAQHIAGALPRPLGDSVDLGSEIPKDQLIISYCT